ncbi:MAG: ATP-binding protein [Sciscionella sp.]
MNRLVVDAAPLAGPCHASLPPAIRGHERCAQLRAKRTLIACAELPGSKLIAGTAREFAGRVLCAWGCSVLLDRVVRVVSELATNALLHGGVRAMTVARIYRDGDAVWFEIDDRSAAEPQMRLPGDGIEEKADGWGLFLVDALTEQFGWREADSGKTVFARWSLSAEAAVTGTEAAGS